MASSIFRGRKRHTHCLERITNLYNYEVKFTVQGITKEKINLAYTSTIRVRNGGK